MKKIICALLTLTTLLCFTACGGNNKEPFVYAQNTDGSLTVTAYKGKIQDTVTIPETYQDRQVTAIGAMAFEGTFRMTEVIIPEGVTEIGDSAFANCAWLNTPTLPDSLQKIGDWAFQNCKGLTEPVIPEGTTSVGQYAFKGCTGITAITLPKSLKTVGVGAFSELTSLISYTGPLDMLTHVNRTKLTSVTIIAEKYDQITFTTFMGCDALTEISYTGTAAEWQALEKKEGWVSILPQKQLTVHCSDKDIIES